MARSRCPACGAQVDVVLVAQQPKALGDDEVEAESFTTVVIDTFPDSSSDAPRYRIIGHKPLMVERVAAAAVGDYFPEHNYDCPGGNAGRR